MKKADINNIVNEEVSKLRTIVEQEVNEYVGLGTLSALAIGAALAARLGFMSDEKLQQAIDTTKDKANKLVKALPIIGDKIEQRELRNKQMDGIQKYLNDELTDQDIIDIFKTNPELKKAMENIGVSYAYKDYYNLIRDLGGAANEWGNAHPKFKALRKKIKQGELDINENIPPVKPMSPKFTAKEFVEYVNDEFDSETLQLMQNVLAERMKFLDKMKDMANPRTVVQGYMRKDDLKENLGRYQVAIQEGAFSELEILADESSNFDEFLAKVKEEFPQIKYIKPDMEDFLQTLYQNNLRSG